MYLFCDKYITFCVDKSYKAVSRRLVMWQNCFTYIALFLLFYHHRDGFVHSIIAVKL